MSASAAMLDTRLAAEDALRRATRSLGCSFFAFVVALAMLIFSVVVSVDILMPSIAGFDSLPPLHTNRSFVSGLALAPC